MEHHDNELFFMGHDRYRKAPALGPCHFRVSFYSPGLLPDWDEVLESASQLLTFSTSVGAEHERSDESSDDASDEGIGEESNSTKSIKCSSPTNSNTLRPTSTGEQTMSLRNIGCQSTRQRWKSWTSTKSSPSNSQSI